jgi:hypothetical protein
MSKPIRILLQTTTAAVEDDWNIESFSLLREHRESLTSEVIDLFTQNSRLTPLKESQLSSGKNEMIRRQFLSMTAATLASSALSGCTSRRAAEVARPAQVAQGPLNAMAFHAARQYAKTSFGKIAYVEDGTGDAALFLHGFPLNGFQWRGALERLAAHGRCIAPDFMGLGYTEVADGQSVAPDAQVAMLASFLDSLRQGLRLAG